MAKKVDLDDFDRRLIAEVRRDNQQPARELAGKVGLSVSAVQRRLRRLRARIGIRRRGRGVHRFRPRSASASALLNGAF